MTTVHVESLDVEVEAEAEAEAEAETNGTAPSGNGAGVQPGGAADAAANVMRFIVYDGKFGAAFKPYPKLDADVCLNIIRDADEFVLSCMGSLWDNDRHSYAETTDVDALKSYDIPRSLVVCKACAPVLTWIRELYDIPRELDLELRDCFVARYKPNEQPSLKRHVDGTLLSFIIALSDSTAYDGGETHLGTNTTGSTHSVRLERGEYLVFPGGLLHHSVKPVTRGERYMLVGFVSITCTTWFAARRMLDRYQDRVKERLAKYDSARNREGILRLLQDIPSQLSTYATKLPPRV